MKYTDVHFSVKVAAYIRASDDEVYALLASPHGYTLAPERLSDWQLGLPVLCEASFADAAGRFLLMRKAGLSRRR